MKTVTPGTIVYINNEVYIVKRKVGVYQCWACAMLKACQDFLEEHMFTACYDFLIHTPLNDENAGLILRKPFKMTEENMGKRWPKHSVVEVNGRVGIIVTSLDVHLTDIKLGCVNCLLRCPDCGDFKCLPTERRDHLNIFLLPIETAIAHKLVQVINTDENND